MWKVMEESVMGCKDRTDPNLLSKIQKMKGILSLCDVVCDPLI